MSSIMVRRTSAALHGMPVKLTDPKQRVSPRLLAFGRGGWGSLLFQHLETSPDRNQDQARIGALEDLKYNIEQAHVKSAPVVN
jgi:hypothetical protein